ncbi:hypothetical protein CR513_23723, partial [Mucuna pruriens]
MATEFVAFFEASNHEIWLQNFVTSLRVVDGIERPLKIYCDNNSAVLYSSNNRSSTKSKFINIKPESREHLGQAEAESISAKQKPRASRPSRSREHLGQAEAKIISAQADFSGKNHSGKNADITMLKLRNLKYRFDSPRIKESDQGINDSVGLDLDLASLCINRAHQATSSDQDLESWKLSKVIARYNRRTLLDGNLNVWPSLVHHCRPFKAIVMEGRFSGTFEFLT